MNCLRQQRTLPVNLSLMLLEMFQTSLPENSLAAIQKLIEHLETEHLTKLRDAAFDDLTAFSEYMNPEEPPALHHRFVCDRLMAAESGEVRRGLVSMPPGSGKSVYCSRMFPAWYLGRNPKKKFIQGGHTQNFVESEFGKKTRDLIDDEKYHDIFPEVSLDPSMRAAGKWGLSNLKGGYLAKGVGQAIAGFRGNIAVVDDPIGSREDAQSQTVRDKVFNWYTADLKTRLLPYSAEFIVATRWHSDDLCGRIEDMSKKGLIAPFEIINIPMIYEDDSEPDPLGRKLGDTLWPDFYPPEDVLETKRGMTPSDWNSLYMGQPMDAAGGTAKAEWFKYYSGDIRKKVIVRRIVLSVDTATKTQERHDYTAILVWMEDTEGKFYLLDVVRKKVEFTELCLLIDSTARRWNASVILVEDKGAGTQYYQTRAGKAPAPIIPIPTTNNDKEFRFDAVSPMIEAGLVYLPEHSTWGAEYEREILAFPNGKNDDQVDATSQFLFWARNRQRKGKSRQLSIGPKGGFSGRVQQVERALEKMLRERAEQQAINEQQAQMDVQPETDG